jgi:hypothetical protein
MLKKPVKIIKTISSNVSQTYYAAIFLLFARDIRQSSFFGAQTAIDEFAQATSASSVKASQFPPTHNETLQTSSPATWPGVPRD